MSSPIVIEKFYKWEWDYEYKHCGNPINERGIGCFWTTESQKLFQGTPRIHSWEYVSCKLKVV